MAAASPSGSTSLSERARADLSVVATLRERRWKREWNKPFVRGVAVVTGIVAMWDAASPTGIALLDRVWCAVAAAVLVMLSSRATRTTWMWMTGVAGVAAVGDWRAIFAFGGLAIAYATVKKRRRPRAPGALVGALTALTLFNLPTGGFHGLQTLVVVVAVTPVVLMAYQRSPRRVRRHSRIAFRVAVGIAVVGSGLFGLVALLSAGAVRSAIAHSQAGVDLVGDGDQEGANEEFLRAEADFREARDLLDGPWVWPAQAIPVLSQHSQALSAGASSGYDLASSARVATSTAPYRELRAADGRVDLERVRAMQTPIRDATRSLRAADVAVRDARSPWLVAPAVSALDRLAGEVDDILPEAELADQALQVAPGLFGGEGDRTYLVLFTTPAESRNLGGFIGAYALLSAVDGDVDVVESGGFGELGNPGSAERAIEGHDEFLKRYGRYQPARFLQNLSASPDMATTAAVSAQMFEQTTGTAVDGVMVADPFALAAFLELTGPVQVPNIEEAVTAENAAQMLLFDQYVRYEGERDTRQDRLVAAGRAVFDALTQRELPTPRGVGDALGPVVREKRLMFFPFAEGELSLMEDLGADGRFVVPDRADFLSVRTANRRANKIDTFVHRSISYDALYDPDTGSVDSLVRVTFRNDAPSAGLPEYVIGPAGTATPQGTAKVFAGIYTPLHAESASIDGRPVGLEFQRELGANVFSAEVVIPPQSSVTFEVRLLGTIEGMGEDYRLDLSSQPLSNPDTLEVVITRPDGVPSTSRGVDIQAGRARGAFEWTTDRSVTVGFAEPPPD